MKYKIITFIFLSLPLNLLAQKAKEGSMPIVKVYLIKGDSATRISYLKKNEDNRIRVEVGAGMEHVKHIVIVTSKDAIVKPVPDVKNEFFVKPETDKPCEIIVDVKTFETYHYIKMVDAGNGKKIKQIVKKYPPKTYMIGYEKYKVK
jgi:hypothetical protein